MSANGCETTESLSEAIVIVRNIFLCSYSGFVSGNKLSVANCPIVDNKGKNGKVSSSSMVNHETFSCRAAQVLEQCLPLNCDRLCLATNKGTGDKTEANSII